MIPRKVNQILTLVIVIMTILPATLWAGTLNDNFNSGNMSRWDLSGAPQSMWAINNGELVVTPRSPVEFYTGETTWKDYTISVRAKIAKSQPSGAIESVNISARSKAPLYGYVFGLGTLSDSNKYIFCFRANGSTIVSISVFKPFEWELDKWYDLKLIAEGNRFRFYVNNELFIEYTDATYPAGKVGITAGFSTTTAHFDDFSVTGNDVPDILSSVPPKDKLVTTWGKIKG